MDAVRPLLTVAQVAERLSATRAFVYNLMQRGRLAHYNLGERSGGKRVSEEQLADYLRRVEEGPPPEPVRRRVLKSKVFDL